VETDPLNRLVWRHEIEESPFERILRESITEVEIEPADAGLSNVSLTLRQRPRGFARLGFLQLRLAAVRQVEGALDGLEAVLGSA
jgi:hypothetical protein